MREQLYACEERFLLSYLERLENATAAEHQVAASMFARDDDDDDLTAGIYEETPEGVLIRIVGVLSSRGLSPIARLFGFAGTGYPQIMAAAQRARERKPRSVTLAINSPGGEVAGVDPAWQALYAMAREIPTTARNDGLMASAAYWLASASGRIVATSPAAEQGSIGVIIVGIDDSKMGEKLGIRRVKIVSRRAPDKGADVDTAHGRAILQERADSLESVFIQRVASGRRTTEDDVAANYGKGAVLIASAALSVGMIDAIVSAVEPSRVAVGAAAHAGTSAPQPITSSAVAPVIVPATVATTQESSPQRRTTMTLAELLQANPGARAEYDAALKAAADGAKAEAVGRAKAVGKYLTSDTYGKNKPIVERCIKALQGEISTEAVEAAVAMFDLLAEQAKDAAAKVETNAQPETPAQFQAPSAELSTRAAALKIDVAAVTAAAKQFGLDPAKALQAEVESREQAQRDAKAGA